MANLVGDLSGLVGGTIGGVKSWVTTQWTQRIVQVSVYAGIVFFILSSYDLIDVVEKFLSQNLDIKVGKDGARALHAVIFMLFMYIGSRFILDPLVNRIAKDDNRTNQ